MQIRECNQVGFVVGGNGKNRVTDLFNIDCPREGCLLCIVTFQIYSMLLVRDPVGGSRRVVTRDPSVIMRSVPDEGYARDLFRYQLSHASIVLPLPEEELA
jgi:hypothetical protein